jgi:hypothetical protein
MSKTGTNFYSRLIMLHEVKHRVTDVTYANNNNNTGIGKCPLRFQSSLLYIMAVFSLLNHLSIYVTITERETNINNSPC